MALNKRILLACAAMGLATSAGIAHAQTSLGSAADAAPSNFKRDRNISVRQRPHQGYEALGARAGAFMIWPKVTTTLERNDNVYAVSTNEQSDTVLHILPELNITSTWSRHLLQAYARSTINKFKDFETENTTDYSLGAQGRLDILRTEQLSGGFDFSKLTEPRTSSSSPSNSAEPIRYKLDSAYVTGMREFNRLRISGRADVRKYNYLNGVTTAGTPVLQDDRDRTQTQGTVRGDYAVSPDTAVFVELSANKRAYRLDNPPASQYPGFVNRDSDGVQALVGANFELSAVMRGEVGVGYMKQKYDNPTFNDISGLGARAQVEYFPTQLLTVTLTGSRTVEDSGIQRSAGYLSTNLGAQVDYEFLRNVIVSAQAGYGDDDYRGIDRKDKRFNAGLSATYLLNRNVGVTVGVTHFEQSSKGVNGGQDFDVNKVGATLTLQY